MSSGENIPLFCPIPPLPCSENDIRHNLSSRQYDHGAWSHKRAPERKIFPLRMKGGRQGKGGPTLPPGGSK